MALEIINNYADDGETGLSARTKLNNMFAELYARYETKIRSNDNLSYLDFEKVGEEGNALLKLGLGKSMKVYNGVGLLQAELSGNAALTIAEEQQLNLGFEGDSYIKKGISGNFKLNIYNSDATTSFLPGHQFRVNGVDAFSIDNDGKSLFGNISGADLNPNESRFARVNIQGADALYLYENQAAGERVSITFGNLAQANSVKKSASISSLKVDAGYRTNLVFGTCDNSPNNIIDFVWFTHQQRVGIGLSNPTAKLHVAGLINYADNATAVAAGHTVGAFYRTGGDLKIVI